VGRAEQNGSTACPLSRSLTGNRGLPYANSVAPSIPAEAKVVNHQEYRENRSRIPLQALAKLRGQWVAFSLDGRHVIASNEDLAKLDSLVIAAGENPEKVALEWIELESSSLGGAELL
jgi:hypothetical protein